ncbi:hypothetical protein [Streptomyces viridochromogenes]|uniref:hypothetical protein n=1 Tax=Streptomyces viridochromogenes TaxID=1938 RepID=UPI000ABD58DA|nr:hypothetical protein [Streptomyces viridochromogenes]
MTTFESPRDAHGNRLCEYCGDPVPKSLGTKPKRYCKRSCRQRAYEVRKNREATIAAVAMAVARDRTSRDDARTGSPMSRDVPKPLVAPGVPAPAPSGDFLLAPPAASPQEPRVLPESRRAPMGPMPPVPPGKRRRPLLPPAPGVTRETLPLFDDTQFSPGDGRADTE